MFQVLREETFTTLLVQKGSFTKEKFSDIAKVVNREMKKKRESME
jgi:hypothetical protein